MMSNVSDNASARAGERDGDDDGLRQLRHAIAESVMARMKKDVPGLSPHFGEHYETTDDPEAIVYRSTGGTFRFLAFAFAPWRMWDLHVGVVPIDRRRLSVGFHISERASPALMTDLKRLGAGINAAVQHQKAAVEYQANLPPIAAAAVSLDAIVDTVSELCRKYAPFAASVASPPEMHDDAH